MSDKRPEPEPGVVVDELIAHAHAVNSALQRYIAVHDAVLARKFSLREILPLPFLFKPIDYGALWEETESVVSQLEATEHKLDMLSMTRAEESRDADDLLAYLEEYISALLDTVGMLAQLCSRLFKKSQGEPFGWHEYNLMCDKYTASIPAYQRVGVRLSALMRKVNPSFFMHD